MPAIATLTIRCKIPDSAIREHKDVNAIVRGMAGYFKAVSTSDHCESLEYVSHTIESINNGIVEEPQKVEETTEQIPVKRGRGRPRLNKDIGQVVVKRKRGRPRKELNV